MNKIICEWTTYKGSHCKKIVGNKDNNNNNNPHNSCNDKLFCDLHRDLINMYLKIEESELESELCETFKEIKLVPRSHKHIKSIMSSIGNEDDEVQVYLSGGSIEDADITNTDCIILKSDNSKFYYSPERGQNKAKNLKIILREYCQHNCLVNYDGMKYCEECYKKLNDVPRISLIT
jgi:hypothetical protein